MKILIIDDEADSANKISEVLTENFVGAVITICTKTYDRARRAVRMPELFVIESLIEESDVILLDQNLGEESFDGRMILTKWRESKIIIGISAGVKPFAKLNWSHKHSLDDRHYGPKVAKELCDIVRTMAPNHCDDIHSAETVADVLDMSQQAKTA